MKTMLIYGAGNIGRGFLADLGNTSGYECIFVDVREQIVDALNQDHGYTHLTVGSNGKKERYIDNVRAIHGKDTQALCQAIGEASLITTAVGKDALPSICPTLRAGLLQRIKKGNHDPLQVSVIACENIHGNTDYLRALIMQGLDLKDQTLLGDKIHFPNSIVDRIVPNYTGEHLLDVCVEEYHQLAVDAQQVDVAFHLEGVELTDDLHALADQKLFTLNMGHALTAYLGHLAGERTIHEAIQNPNLEAMVTASMQEISLLLSQKYATITYDAHQHYVTKTIQRFKNPYLNDKIDRVARDPIRKLGPQDRLVHPFKELLHLGIFPSFLGSGIAGALHYTNRDDTQATILSQEIQTLGLNHVLEHRLGIGNHTDHDHTLQQIIRSNYLLRAL